MPGFPLKWGKVKLERLPLQKGWVRMHAGRLHTSHHQHQVAWSRLRSNISNATESSFAFEHSPLPQRLPTITVFLPLLLSDLEKWPKILNVISIPYSLSDVINCFYLEIATMSWQLPGVLSAWLHLGCRSCYDADKKMFPRTIKVSASYKTEQNWAKKSELTVAWLGDSSSAPEPDCLGLNPGSADCCWACFLIFKWKKNPV